MALVVLLHFVTQCFYIPTINGDDTLINTVIVRGNYRTSRLIGIGPQCFLLIQLGGV